MQINVSELSSQTLLTMSVLDKNNGKMLLNLTNSNANTSYTVSPVAGGDSIIVAYSSNVVNQLGGNGIISVSFIYAGTASDGFSGEIPYLNGASTYFRFALPRN